MKEKDMTLSALSEWARINMETIALKQWGCLDNETIQDGCVPWKPGTRAGNVSWEASLYADALIVNLIDEAYS